MAAKYPHFHPIFEGIINNFRLAKLLEEVGGHVSVGDFDVFKFFFNLDFETFLKMGNFDGLFYF